MRRLSLLMPFLLLLGLTACGPDAEEQRSRDVIVATLDTLDAVVAGTYAGADAETALTRSAMRTRFTDLASRLQQTRAQLRTDSLAEAYQPLGAAVDSLLVLAITHTRTRGAMLHDLFEATTLASDFQVQRDRGVRALEQGNEDLALAQAREALGLEGAFRAARAGLRLNQRQLQQTRTALQERAQQVAERAAAAGFPGALTATTEALQQDDYADALADDVLAMDLSYGPLRPLAASVYQQSRR